MDQKSLHVQKVRGVMENTDQQSKSILCIEDDQFISDMYVRALKKAGYDVDFATTGEAGTKMALAKRYSLILLDIFLPEKDGLEVLHELRDKEEKGAARSKIVIMTNYAHDDESRAALEAEADGYFIKADITPAKLVTLVRQLIG